MRIIVELHLREGTNLNDLTETLSCIPEVMALNYPEESAKFLRHRRRIKEVE